MDVQFLRYFLAVARQESITKAAEVLHITQPTLSRAAVPRQRRAGGEALARGTRRLSLTTDGLLLRRRAEEILELVDKTERELAEQKGSIEGTVALGCGDLGAVRAACQSYCALLPGGVPPGAELRAVHRHGGAREGAHRPVASPTWGCCWSR